MDTLIRLLLLLDTVSGDLSINLYKTCKVFYCRLKDGILRYTLTGEII